VSSCADPDLNLKLGGKGGAVNLTRLSCGALRLLPLAVLAGCATDVTVTPQLAEKNIPPCQIHGLVRYQGKPEYLPSALVPDQAPPSQIAFEGETFTDMRRRGLLLVRDNLTSQLCKDQSVIETLLADRPTTAKGSQ